MMDLDFDHFGSGSESGLNRRLDTALCRDLVPVPSTPDPSGPVSNVSSTTARAPGTSATPVAGLQIFQTKCVISNCTVIIMRQPSKILDWQLVVVVDCLIVQSLFADWLTWTCFLGFEFWGVGESRMIHWGPFNSVPAMLQQRTICLSRPAERTKLCWLSCTRWIQKHCAVTLRTLIKRNLTSTCSYVKSSVVSHQCNL